MPDVTPAVAGRSLRFEPAVLSPDRRYRYVLRRRVGLGDRQATFIMLNPSTANETQDDPTIRRCIGFAQREGCGILGVVNLFAWRATNPKELRRVPEPVGPLNDDYILAECNNSHLVIAAWGAHGSLYNRAAVVRWMLDVPLYHLGLTKDSHPRHPLYVPSSQPLERIQ